LRAGCCVHAGGPIKSAVQAILAEPQALYIAAVLEQLIENAVVLAKEADQQLDIGSSSSKVCAAYVRGRWGMLAARAGTGAHGCLKRAP
jgi:hypothetical protein